MALSHSIHVLDPTGRCHRTAAGKAMTSTQSGGGKPICPICFEDLKPIAEDLQSITVCGHVFHELCLQQWLEYCPPAKKPTCPVCKQSFPRASLLRLYFQSFGNPADADADAERLAEDARRLEAQKKRVLELSEEVSRWKERAREEGSAKDGIRLEKDRVNQQLREKEKELAAATAECARLNERSLDLAKELASLKLAVDLNLDEGDIMNVASIGRGMQLAIANEVLKKSLVVSKKRCKDLTTQCNLSGISESRAVRKLEKADERIKRLKARLQELEKVLEEKENGFLRNLRLSKKETCRDVLAPGSPCIDTHSHGAKHENSIAVNNSNIFTCLGTSHTVDMKETDHKFHMDPALVRKRNPSGSVAPMSRACFAFEKHANDSHSDLLKTSAGLSDHCHPPAFQKDVAAQQLDAFKQVPSPPEKVDDHVGTSQRCNKLSSSICDAKNVLGAIEMELRSSEDLVSGPAVVCVDDDLDCEILLHNDSETIPYDKVYNSSEATGSPYGLVGTKDSNRYPGKWCRRGQATVTLTMETSTSAGSLIAVGADGRGGKIKVLRTPSQHIEKLQGLPSKRRKGEVKQAPPSSSCLQIEHFFGCKGK